MLYLSRFIQFISILCLTGTPGQDDDEQKKKAKAECISYFDNSAQADSLRSSIDTETLCDCMVEKVYTGFSEEELQRIEQKGINKMTILKIITKIKPCITKELEEY